MLKVKPIIKGEQNLVSTTSNLAAIPLQSSITSWLRLVYLAIKEMIDRVVAFLLIIVLFPGILLTSIIIRLDSPGHPIFTQERVGKNGYKFIAYKFRTMKINNDDSQYKAYLKKYILQNAPYKTNEKGEKVFKLVDDLRITRMGAVLRKTNLDEVPQLINILKGEMSFIGPRPDIPFSTGLYNKWHEKRLAVKPGITGLWQVNHRKGLSFDDMVQLDIEYIRRLSPFLDLKISLLTIRTMLMGDGS
jgi:lipopolysaccharide/colanic/teichoic acid biosynthesis glycosyltransferase